MQLQLPYPAIGLSWVCGRRGDEHEFVDAEPRQLVVVLGAWGIRERHREVELRWVATRGLAERAQPRDPFARADGIARLNPYQPAPVRAARRSAASLLPPTMIGMRPSRTGLGLTRMSETLTTPIPGARRPPDGRSRLAARSGANAESV
jgi:hypothetical protein